MISSKEINDYVLKNTNQDEMLSKKYYDIDISNIDITPQFIKDLDIFEPCGFKNEKPTFKVGFSFLFKHKNLFSCFGHNIIFIIETN